MRKNSVVLLTVVLVCAVSAAPAGAAWKAFSPEGGAFTVVMPGTPTYQQKTDKTPVGHIGEHIWTVKEGKMTVTAEYSDLPEIAVLFGGHHDIYKKTFAAFLKDVQGKELSVSDFTAGGWAGEELSYETATRTGKVRALLIHKRLFVLQASAVKGAGDDAAMDRYLASFQPHSSPPREHRRPARSWRRGGNKR